MYGSGGDSKSGVRRMSGPLDSLGEVWSRRLKRRQLLAGSVAAGVLAGTGVACRQSNSGAKQPTSRSGSSPSAAGTPKRGGTLALSLLINPAGLDPDRTTSALTFIPLSAVMSRLLRFKTGADPKIGE